MIFKNKQKQQSQTIQRILKKIRQFTAHKQQQKQKQHHKNNKNTTTTPQQQQQPKDKAKLNKGLWQQEDKEIEEKKSRLKQKNRQTGKKVNRKRHESR